MGDIEKYSTQTWILDPKGFVSDLAKILGFGAYTKVPPPHGKMGLGGRFWWFYVYLGWKSCGMTILQKTAPQN